MQIHSTLSLQYVSTSYFVDSNIKTWPWPTKKWLWKFVWYCKVPRTYIALSQSINSQTIRHQCLITKVGLTPLLCLIVLTKCLGRNYIELYYIEIMFSENFIIDVDSLVINKYDLALKNNIFEQFLKSLYYLLGTYLWYSTVWVVNKCLNPRGLNWCWPLEIDTDLRKVLAFIIFFFCLKFGSERKFKNMFLFVHSRFEPLRTILGEILLNFGKCWMKHLIFPCI